MRHATTIIIGLALLGATRAVSAGAQSQPTLRTQSMTEARSMTQRSTPVHAGYANVNGLRMYYELHGTEGFPLVLDPRRRLDDQHDVRPHPADARAHASRDRGGDAGARSHARHRPPVHLHAGRRRHRHAARHAARREGGRLRVQQRRHDGAAGRDPASRRRCADSSSRRRTSSATGWSTASGTSMEKGTFADMPQIFKDELRKIDPSDAAAHALFDRDSKRMLAFKDIPDQRDQVDPGADARRWTAIATSCASSTRSSCRVSCRTGDSASCRASTASTSGRSRTRWTIA